MPPARLRRSVAAGVAAGLLSLGLAVVWSWPLALEWRRAVPGAGPGDSTQFLWNLWWTRTALAAPETRLLRSDRIFHPFGANLALHTHTASYGLVGATLLASKPLVPALNTILIAVLALNALAAGLLAFEVTRSRRSAALAAVLFGGSSFVLAHLHGHFNLVSAWILPLSLLLFRRAFQGSGAAGLLLGLCLAAGAATDYYLATFSLAAMAVLAALATWVLRVELRPARPRGQGWLLGSLAAAGLAIAWIEIGGGTRLQAGGLTLSLVGTKNLLTLAWLLLVVWLARRFRPRLAIQLGVGARETWRQARRPLAAAAAVAALLAWPLLHAAIELVRDGDYTSPARVWRNATRGIDAAALVLGQPFHPVWGETVARIHDRLGIDPIEECAWLGVVPLLLLATGWKRLWADSEARRWLALGAVALLWALGPRLRVLDVDTGLWLPQALARYLPILANARIPGRSMVVVHLAAAMLAALAVAGRGRWPPRRLALLLLAALADSAVRLPLWAPAQPRLYRELALRPGRGAVLELPLGIADGFGEMGRLDHATLYYQTLHRRAGAGGYISRLSGRTRAAYLADPLLGPLLALSAPGASPPAPGARPREGTLALHARRLGIDWIVLDRRSAPPALRDLVESDPSLVEVDRDEIRTLFAPGG